MNENDRTRQSDTDGPIPANSDPTGGGPPPPGAQTQVVDGQGVATGPKPAGRPDEAEPDR